jgi:hypothetical protein
MRVCLPVARPVQVYFSLWTDWSGDSDMMKMNMSDHPIAYVMFSFSAVPWSGIQRNVDMITVFANWTSKFESGSFTDTVPECQWSILSSVKGRWLAGVCIAPVLQCTDYRFDGQIINGFGSSVRYGEFVSCSLKRLNNWTWLSFPQLTMTALRHIRYLCSTIKLSSGPWQRRCSMLRLTSL